MLPDYYRTEYDPKTRAPLGCVELVDSPDDGGYYAHEFAFTPGGDATRTSSKIYASRDALVRALDAGSHKWGKWE